MEESARPRICDPCATFKRRPDDCGRTSATSRPSTMPSPPSIRPSVSAGRRSFAFVRERHAPIDARGRPALSGSAERIVTSRSTQSRQQAWAKVQGDVIGRLLKAALPLPSSSPLCYPPCTFANHRPRRCVLTSSAAGRRRPARRSNHHHGRLPWRELSARRRFWQAPMDAQPTPCGKRQDLKLARYPAARCPGVVRVGQDIGDMDYPTFQ